MKSLHKTLSEYIKISETLDTEKQHILGVSVNQPKGTKLKKNSHLPKHTFDFAERTKRGLGTGTVLEVTDIKSLYANFSHDLSFEALKH